jgi:hypothetical protein
MGNQVSEIAVNALVIAARNDMKRGISRDQLLKSLNLVVDKETLRHVIERI